MGKIEDLLNPIATPQIARMRVRNRWVVVLTGIILVTVVVLVFLCYFGSLLLQVP